MPPEGARMQDSRKKKKSVGQESWLLALNTNECHLRSYHSRSFRAI